MQMTYGDLFNALGLTEAGYHVSDPDAIFTFDDSNNVDANTGAIVADTSVQSLEITLDPDYQSASVISTNQPAINPATGEAFAQLPQTNTAAQGTVYAQSGVSNGSITLSGVSDSSLARQGYLYTVTGPNNIQYATLALAIAANSKFDTTSNGDADVDSVPQNFTVNYEVDPISQSTSSSTSLSDSTSKSTSLSDSTSKSTSLSDSTSKSTSLSDSTSKSTSLSDSTSKSTSLSDSTSKSTSLSDSTSKSTSLSDSTSKSTSL
ncbi:hypothetical protein, partial [Lactiplantibacillus plantarum]|uniref:hypothetical protein n=1 Tax=Lactiplantibacillus plantarum TaxID=1590 RepID=UPI001BA50F11